MKPKVRGYEESVTRQRDEARAWGRDEGSGQPQDKAVKARSQPNSLHSGEQSKVRERQQLRNPVNNRGLGDCLLGIKTEALETASGILKT